VPISLWFKIQQRPTSSKRIEVSMEIKVTSINQTVVRPMAVKMRVFGSSSSQGHARL